MPPKRAAAGKRGGRAISTGGRRKARSPPPSGDSDTSPSPVVDPPLPSPTLSIGEEIPDPVPFPLLGAAIQAGRTSTPVANNFNGAGFIGGRNMCYRNSVIALLMGTPTFVEYVRSHHMPLEFDVSLHGPNHLLRQLSLFIEVFWNDQSADDKRDQLKKIMDEGFWPNITNLEKSSNDILSWDPTNGIRGATAWIQHDASDFMMNLLSNVRAQLAVNPNHREIFDALFHSSQTSRKRCAGLCRDVKFRTNTVQAELFLTLSIFSQEQHSLEECIASNFKAPSAWLCPECQEKQTLLLRTAEPGTAEPGIAEEDRAAAKEQNMKASPPSNNLNMRRGSRYPRRNVNSTDEEKAAVAEALKQSQKNAEIAKKAAEKVKGEDWRAFQHTPETMFVNIARFSAEIKNQQWVPSKNNTPIDIPEILDISRWIDKVSPEFGTKIEYRLTGMVRHTGSLRGGHYIADIRTPSGEWLEYNDAKVTKTSWENLSKVFKTWKTSTVQRFTPVILTYSRIPSTADSKAAWTKVQVGGPDVDVDSGAGTEPGAGAGPDAGEPSGNKDKGDREGKNNGGDEDKSTGTLTVTFTIQGEEVKFTQKLTNFDPKQKPLRIAFDGRINSDDDAKANPITFSSEGVRKATLKEYRKQLQLAMPGQDIPTLAKAIKQNNAKKKKQPTLSKKPLGERDLPRKTPPKKDSPSGSTDESGGAPRKPTRKRKADVVGLTGDGSDADNKKPKKSRGK